jgi:hypothetical protein
MDPSLTTKVFGAELDSEDLDFEQEFYIILHSAVSRNLSSGFSYVTRTRRLTKKDGRNFFALAAETVVACYRNNHSNLHKYYEIQNCLAKARRAANKNAQDEMKALGELEMLTEQIIDIFDY